MKKHFILATVLVASLAIAACGSGNTETTSTSTSAGTTTSTSSETGTSLVINEDPVVVSVSETEKDPEVVAEPESIEGKVRSDLTNEWIDEALENQRPVAVMVDNESVPLPHYGTSNADIVYELMNSTANGRITRLMCIFKDYESVEQIGNIRSVRPTNIIIAPEYNAILVHDGGPFYINEWFAYSNAKEHLSSGFARIDREKASYYEEYATNTHYTGVGEYEGKSYKSLAERIASAGYSKEYNSNYMGKHFEFSDTKLTLDNEANVINVSKVELPYPHNSSKLIRNASTGLYEYYEYGSLYIDALYGDENRTLAFENLIIVCCDYVEYDEHGYMCYYALNDGHNNQVGYYVTEGKAIPIKWSKPDMYSLTTFTNAATGEPIVLNTGKTYITYVPQDVWGSLVIE